MNKDTLRSLHDGLHNANMWYTGNRDWAVDYIDEALYVLENREHLLEEYECYDYLFE